MNKYLTVKEASKLFPFSESGIRWLIFNGQKNGFNSCVIRVGKKILIEAEAFEAWINKKKDTKNDKSI